MSLIRWSPARDLATFPSDIASMQREMNKVFDSFFRGETDEGFPLTASSWRPAVDIAEEEDAFQVKMELPGVAKEDVKITMENDLLTVRGEKKQEKETKGKNYHRIERGYGLFQRSFTLPVTVRGEKIEASFRDGILNITLPKSEEAKPKEIEVRVK